MDAVTSISGGDVHGGRRRALGGRLSAPLDWLRDHRRWALLVLLPTVIAAAYFYLLAADQYETEAHFVVRAANSSRVPPSGMEQALSMVGGGGGAASSQQDAMIVADYLTSHDAVDALQRRVNLVQMFRRPEADIASRLWTDQPAPETLLKYFDGKAKVQVSTETGITSLRVRAFRPGDAMKIIQTLLAMGEERVNALNARNYQSAVALSTAQVIAADRTVREMQREITGFRRQGGDFNPQTTGTARTTLVSTLQARLAAARAQQSALSAALSPSSPQVVAMREQVAALERQVSAEQRRLASGPGNVATGLGTYEGLQLRQQLAGKQYEAAMAAMTRAREDAAKQQLFLVRVVDPNMPVKSLYPKRLRNVATVFFALLLAYGIGWLIAAGVKEHAA